MDSTIELIDLLHMVSEIRDEGTTRVPNSIVVRALSDPSTYTRGVAQLVAERRGIQVICTVRPDTKGT